MPAALTGQAEAMAFGLSLRPRGVELPWGAAVAGGGRELLLDFDPGAPPGLGFPAAAAAISDEREADGSLLMEIRHDDDAGYLVRGPRYGENLLAANGLSMRCRPGEGGETAWLRLLVAHALPLAALLRGLEVLHASAVVHDGAAVGLLGPSGAGKSVLAAALRERGAAFFADDVLALELTDRRPRAHAGPPLAGVVGDREALAPVEPGPAAAPLGALFLLDRRKGGPASPRFETAADPRLLLGSTFNAVLTSPSRLARQLNVCAAAAAGRVERLIVDRAAPAATIAAALQERLEDGR